MSRFEITIQILKYLAIAVSFASGLYGTLYTTKEKIGGGITYSQQARRVFRGSRRKRRGATERLNRAGKIVLGCLIASTLIAVLTQSIETKIGADKATQAKKDRDEQATQLATTVASANDASDKSDSAAKSSLKAVDDLRSVKEAQTATLEATWRMQRPFGKWVATSYIHNIRPGESKDDKEWVKWALDRAESTHKSGVSATWRHSSSHSSDDIGLVPRWAKDGVIALAFTPEPRSRPRFFSFLDDYTSGADLVLRLKPEGGTVYAEIDRSAKKITSVKLRTVYAVEQTQAKPLLSNWIDLYGSEVMVAFSKPLGDSDGVHLTLSYQDTINPHNLNQVWHATDRETLDQNGLTYYATILTENELGQFPDDYKRLFPDKVKLIEERLKARAKSSPKVAGKPD
jgi:hypothetical protein